MNSKINNTSSDTELQIPSILELFGIFLEKIWLIIGITIATLAIGIVIAYLQPNQYWARSLLLIVEPEKEIYLNAQEYKDLMVLPKRTDAFYNTQIELIRGYPIVRKLMDRLNIKFSEDLYKKIQKQLNVRRLSNTQLIQISIIYPDPVIAAKFVNTLAEVYVEQYKADFLSITREFVSMVLKGKGNLPDEQSRKLLEKILGSADKSTVGVLQARRSEVAQRLDELTIYYKEEHPDVLALKNKLAELDQEIDKEVRKVVESWQESLNSQTMIDKIRIVEYAAVPTQPIGVTRLKTILFSLLFGLGSGCAIVFVLHQFDPRIKSEDELISEASLVSLGTIPLKTPHGSLEKFSKLPADLKDAFAYLRTAILFTVPADRSHAILISSSLPQEGKTAIASNLAVSFASGGLKTILIDTNLRKPAVHSLFHCAQDPGLTDYLNSQADINSIIIPTDIEGLSVIPAGGSVLNTTEILNSDKMAGLMAELKKRFDKIVVDSPAILNVADAVILASFIDSIILVVNTGATDKRLLKKAVDELRLGQMDDKILGGIMNRFNASKRMLYLNPHSR